MATRRKTFVQINDSKKVEIWFPSPYDQGWELEGLEELISDGFTAHGGLVNHLTTLTCFVEIFKLFLALMVKNVTRFLDKSMLAKTKLGNVITSSRSKSKRSASVTDGQTFWTTDPVGLSTVEGEQERFERWPRRTETCAIDFSSLLETLLFSKLIRCA